MRRIVFLVLFCAGFSACDRAAPDAVAGQQSLGAQASPVVASVPAIAVPATDNASVAPQVKSELGPMASIKDLDKQVEAYHLGQNLSEEQARQNLELKQKIIRGTFDIEELCRLALDKHWEPLKPEERAHFVQLMTTLLEKKAIFSKEQLRGENKYYHINYLKEVFQPGDAAKSVVYTRMNVPKRRIDLDLTYKLVKKELGWKIYDVIVDDASLLSNYKFQFDRIIQKGGFSDLINRMEQKLNQIGSQA